MFELHQEQKYVTDIAKMRGIDARLVHHSRATDTCAEKLGLLRETGHAGFELDQIVKAIYVHDDGHVVGIVAPELAEIIPIKELLQSGLDMSKKESKRYTTNGYVPSEMERGTCTPFPCESAVGEGKDISHILIVSHDPIDRKLVDISVGGKGEDAHRASLHIPYFGIYAVLTEKFGDGVVRKVAYRQPVSQQSDNR